VLRSVTSRDGEYFKGSIMGFLTPLIIFATNYPCSLFESSKIADNIFISATIGLISGVFELAVRTFSDRNRLPENGRDLGSAGNKSQE
jgi:hypothetical protein